MGTLRSSACDPLTLTLADTRAAHTLERAENALQRARVYREAQGASLGSGARRRGRVAR